MKLTNDAALPEVLVNAVRNDSYDPGKSDVTVSGLLSPTRLTTLRRRHEEELTEDVADRLWALFGQVVHGILERAGENENVLTEDRLYKKVLGKLIGGQVDSLTLAEADTGWTITDYKFVTAFRFADGTVPIEYEEQLNAYASIFRANGFKVDRVSLLAIYRDWSIGQSLRSEKYPRKGANLWEVPLWPEAKADLWITERVEALIDASVIPDDELPECSDRERWAKPTTWALMKEGRKSAVRVHYSEDEADTHLREMDAKHSITVRPGESIRCKSYCPVSDFCNQWEAIRGTL